MTREDLWSNVFIEALMADCSPEAKEEGGEFVMQDCATVADLALLEYDKRFPRKMRALT